MLKIPTINILDDKYTILYKYVIVNQLPKKYFTILNNKVYNIYDALKDVHLQQYFDPIDLLMIYYESLINQDLLNNYKNWYYNNNNKKYVKFLNAISNGELTEYNTKDIVNRYVELYGKNETITNYFKNMDSVIYYDTDNDNIDILLDNFHGKKNIGIFNDLFTLDDYKYGSYEFSIVPNKKILENILNYANNFESLNYIKYDSKSFMVAYKEWIIITHNDYIKNIETVNMINDNQLLSKGKYKNIKVSPKSVENLIKTYIPTKINNTLVDIYDGMYFFNESIVSEDVPIIIYKNNEHIYYKTHVTYNNTNIPVIANNTIYFYIQHYNVKKYDVLYNLSTNNMNITFYQFEEVDIDKIIHSILPIHIDNLITNDYNMDGYVNIWDFEINESTMADIILNNDIINKSIYVDDSIKNLIKTGLYLQYVPLLSNNHITIEIMQLYYENDKIVKYINNGVEEEIKLKSKTNQIPYLKINFKNVYNYDGFIEIIKMLLDNYYLMDQYDYAKLLTLPSTKELTMDINLRLLKDAAPEVFVEGYANFCGKRPKPINNDLIDDYIKDKISELKLTGKNAEDFKNNAVLEFHTKNQTLNLVCDYSDDIYPYRKSTKIETKMKKLDKTLYEELPCCKKLPIKQKIIKKETTHVITHGIINIPGSYGQIDDNIKYVLNKYNNDNNNNLIRMGVIADNYSFIHCLCIATDDIKYVNTKNKLDYIIKLIPEIAKNTHFDLLKQENYNLDTEVIKNHFLNTKNLDPAIYYRAFEEFFNINIYVFNNNTILDIPKYKLFHTRPVRDERKTVLIYKHLNGHCELIINKYSDTNRVIIFDKDMTVYCHEFLQNIMNILTFSISNKHIITYSNLYSHINTLSFFSNLPSKIYQYIDTNGKLRGLTIYFNKKGSNKKLTILTFSSQPENLEASTNIEYIDINDALGLFTQDPTAAYFKDNNIVGLWYKLFDIEYGVYVPVKGITNIKFKSGPRNNLIQYEYNNMHGYLDMKKLLSILIQIITWIFLVAKYKFDTIYNIDEFLEQYVTVKEISNNAYFDILSIPYRLPTFNKLNKYFLYIHQYCKDLVLDDKLIIYGQPLYNMIKKNIELATFIYTNVHDIPIIIKGYYTYVSDFKAQDDTLIFMNKNTLLNWLNYNTSIIHQTILPIQQYPYIFKDVNNNLFIVQNVKNNTFDEALNVANQWHLNKINIGYNVDKIIVNVEPSIYTPILLSKYNKNINHLDLMVRGSKDYKLLDYKYIDGKIGIYAALLPL